MLKSVITPLEGDENFAIVDGIRDLKGPIKECRQSLTGRSVALSFLLFVTGCLGALNDKNIFNNRDSFVFFERIFDLIEQHHIAPPTKRDLSIAGLENLITIDPDLEFDSKARSLVLSFGGETQRSFSMPLTEDSSAWSLFLTSVISESLIINKQENSLTSGKLYEAILDGFMGELDPFSRYLNPQKVIDYRTQRDGFFGIGITISDDEQGVRVLSLYPDSPAQKAGLQQGDIITGVDGKSIEGLSSSQVASLIKGPRATTIYLSVLRKKADPQQSDSLSFIISRRFVRQDEITTNVIDGIAIITIAGFSSRGARQELENKLSQLLKQNKIDGVVLDLRSNPGGLLSEAIQVSDLFLDKGDIVKTQGREGNSAKLYQAERGDITKGLPIIVFIDRFTASSSEILAAALQDNNRAVVIGSSSFGKGSVQKHLSLQNGGELVLTWAKFFAPSGYSVHQRGILPELCITLLNNKKVDDDISGLTEKTRITSRENSPKSLLREGVEELCPAVDYRGSVGLSLALAVLHDTTLYHSLIYRTDTPKKENRQ